MRALAALAATTLFLAACEEDFVTEVGPVGRDAFANYVAVGTSVSMGTRNGFNATTAEFQITSWPNILAHQAGQRMDLPLFQAPGCVVPAVAPISFGMSQNSLPGNPLAPNATCANLQTGLEPPFQNTAISGHTIRQAVYQTPESVSVLCPAAPQPTTAVCGEGYRRLAVPKILPLQRSQVGAMALQDPTFVSIELGANDLLGALGGLVVPGFSVTAAATYEQLVDVIVDSVQTTGARVLLMGVPTNLAEFPSLWTGAEIAAQATAFLQGFYVAVGADCGTTNAGNYIFLAKVLGAVQQGRANAAAGGAPAPLSCADVPGVVDYTLTPADITMIVGIAEAYNAKLQAVAAENGWAYATIGAPYEQPRPAFSIVNVMTGTQPFGPYISLDGTHPSGAGQRLIANDAIAAINETYGFEIPLLP